MTRMYEAIQLAEARDERKAETLRSSHAPGQTSVSEEQVRPVERTETSVVPRLPIDSAIADTMSELYGKISTQLGDSNCKIVEFIGTHPNAGASVIVRELAKVVAVRHGKSVLLLDASLGSGSKPQGFEVEQARGWDQVLASGDDLGGVLHNVEDSGLSVSRLRVDNSDGALLAAIPGLDRTLNRLRQSFDLILVDAPSPSESSDCFSLSSMVDGVVMVLEAERSRWQVADSFKNRFENSGGRVLGAVLNKRRHHVPKRLYKLL